MRTLIFVFLLACSPKPTVVEATPQAAAEAPAPPFTPEQIRAAMPSGTRIVLSVTEGGGPPRLEEMRVAQSGADSTVIVSTPLDLSGAPLGEGVSATHTWTELADHARFPQGASREPMAFETPLGPAEGWRYVVLAEVNGQVSRTTYDFSSQHPGPPLRMTVEVAGQEVARMEVVAREVPAEE